MKQRYRKLMAIALSILMFSGSSVSYAAEQKMNLTLKDAQSIMSENSIVLMDLEQGVRTLKEAEKKAVEGKQKVEGYYNDYINFVNMYQSGGPKNPLAEAVYGMYTAMFGKEPTKSNKEIYNEFINTIEVTHYDLYQKKETLKLDRIVTEATLNYNVEKLFISLLSLDDAVATNELYIKTLDRKQVELDQQLKLGLVSKYDNDKSKLELSKAKLELKSLIRTRENLELNLKSMIGLSEDQSITVNTNLGLLVQAIKPISLYQADLLKENIKLMKAEINVKTIEREINIMKGYIKDPTDDQRIEAEQRLTNANIAYKELKNDLETSLRKCYIQAISKQKKLSLAQRKLSESQQLLGKINSYYKAGYVKKLDVLNAELAVVQATGDIRKLSNELLQAYDLLDQVVSYGIDIN